MFLAISPALNDATTLFRSGLIVLCPLIYLLWVNIFFKKYIFIYIISLILIVSFIASFISNNQNLYSFLLGGYGRNLGILSLVGLLITLLIYSEEVLKNSASRIIVSLNLTTFFATAYGFVQFFNLDPLQWAEKSYSIPLTLGNPNFSSALLGMLSIIPLHLTVKTQGLKKYTNLMHYLLILLLIIETNSFQGLLLYSLNFLIYILFLNWIRIKKFRKIISVSFAGLICGVFLLNFLKLISLGSIIKELYVDTNIADRLNHWRLAIRMLSDNLILGLGIGDQQKYASEYLRFEDAKIWGNYLHPDKAHSLPLDYFLGGGIFAGIGYLILVIYVFQKLGFLRYSQQDLSHSNEGIVMGILWIGYTVQSVFSPSHIYLDLIGMVAAGTIIGFSLKQYINSKRQIDDK